MNVAPETAGERDPRTALLGLVSPEFAVERGHPLPLGATLRRRGINFAVVSAHASWVHLILYPPGTPTAEAVAMPAIELVLDPRTNRTGDIWHAFVAGLDPGVEYAFRAGGPPEAPDAADIPLKRFDPRCELLDPFAKALVGAAGWGGEPIGDPGPGGKTDDALMVLANSSDEAVLCELPLLGDRRFRLAADSALPSPFDFNPDGAEPLLVDAFTYTVAPHSTVLLVGR